MAKTNTGANCGFERDLCQAADALRSNMDAAEYKHDPGNGCTRTQLCLVQLFVVSNLADTCGTHSRRACVPIN